MIAALGKTVEATRGYAVMATLLMVMLGGAWVPTMFFSTVDAEKSRWSSPPAGPWTALDGMTWRGLSLSARFGPDGYGCCCSLLFSEIVAVMSFPMGNSELTSGRKKILTTGDTEGTGKCQS